MLLYVLVYTTLHKSTLTITVRMRVYLHQLISDALVYTYYINVYV